MALQRNHYEILGVPPTATKEEIKRKYRELARKFHPDLVDDKILGQKVFAQVNAAYRILGDTERRALYDATLDLTGSQYQRMPAGPGKSVSESYTVMPGATAGMNGVSAATRTTTAQTYAQPTAKTYAQASTTSYSQPPTQRNGTQTFISDPQFSDAEGALLGGDASRARTICEAILRNDPNNARALGIMGDALVQLKSYDEAERVYKQALAGGPNSVIRGKLAKVQILIATPPPPPSTKPSPARGAGANAQQPKQSSLFSRLLGKKSS